MGFEMYIVDKKSEIAVDSQNGVESEISTSIDPRNKLNELTGQEWIQETKSFWFQKGLGNSHEHAKIERQHPAPFSFQDVKRLIEFFTKRNQIVLDPFSGVASTCKACALSGRKGIGIELSEHWNSLGKQRLEYEVGPDSLTTQCLITGDSREVLNQFPENHVHFIVTSPPYWSILTKKADHKTKQERIENNLATKYSESSNDLGNIPTYEEFLNELSAVFKECNRILLKGRYMAVIVSDFRNKSAYVPFHADLIAKLTSINFELQGIKVLAQNNKKLYPYGYPFSYVENIHHQYILIFRKPKLGV